MIGNTRLFEAVLALATGKGDARERVTRSLQILDAIHPSELSADHMVRLEKIRNDAGKKGSLRNTVTNAVIRDRYEHTSKPRPNKVYARFAEAIFSIWLEASQKN